MKAFSRFLVAGAAGLVVLQGCGGSHSSGGGSAAPTGKAAVRVAALSSYHSLAAGIAFPNMVLRLTAPAGSGIGTTPTLPKAIAAMVTKARAKALSGRPTAHPDDLEYSDILGLYDSFDTTANSGTFTFYSDAAGTKKVGTITVKTSGPTLVPTTFPATVDAAVDLTAGSLPMKGSCELVIAGGSGQNTLKGSVALTKDDLSFTVDMTLSSALEVGGSVAVTGHSQTITGTNIAGTLDQTLTCDASVQPGGATGKGTLSFADGTIALSLTTAQGTSTASIGTAGGDLVLTYPDGTTETISAPLTASVTSTGTVGGTTTGGGTGSYGAPVAFGSNPDFYTQYGANGNLAGYVTSGFSDVPVYLSSPSGTSQTGSGGGYANALYQGLSGTGSAVGEASATAFAGYQPLFWSSLGATPTAMAIPANYPANRTGGWAQGVNASAQCVGFFDFSTSTAAGDVNNDVVAAYWATPTTPPVKLKNEAGGDATDLAGVHITASGAILGTNYTYSQAISTKRWVVWTSPTANAIALAKAPTTSYGIIGLRMNGSGVVAGTGADGLGYVWSPPSYAPVALKLPAGTTSVIVGGINDAGQIVGTIDNELYLWSGPTATPVDLRQYAPYLVGIDNAGVIVYSISSDSPGGYYALSPK